MCTCACMRVCVCVCVCVCAGGGGGIGGRVVHESVWVYMYIRPLCMLH